MVYYAKGSEKMKKRLNIGWAQTDITPHRPVYVVGQLFLRISSYVHDPLTATCLVIENGEEQVTLVSLDMASLPLVHIPRILAQLNISGFDKKKVVFNATHSHNSTMYGDEPTRENFFVNRLGRNICPIIEEPDNILRGLEAEDFFVEKIVELITAAWNGRRPGGVSTAHDYAVVAFNRRPVFKKADGTYESKMYGNCSQENFIGIEGSSDHSADMLYTWDSAGNLTGVLVCIPCPSQVYELHDFISADYWANVRDSIRDALGNVYVLSLCGAGGDQSPIDLVRISKTNQKELARWNAQIDSVLRNFDMTQECEDIGQRIAAAVVRGYRKARNSIECTPVLKHINFKMDLPLRCVDREEYLEANELIEKVKAQHSAENRLTEAEMIKLFEPLGYINRWEMQQHTQRFDFPVFVFRIGNAAFATNPFELFAEYGIRIKARCKASQTIIIQLSSNAKGGYLPTREAVDGGSYGSKPVSTLVGPDGGDELVKKTIAAIDSLFDIL
jgi:hypothetical protein